MVRSALDSCEPDEVRGALSLNGAYELTLADGEKVVLDTELVQVTVQAEEGFAASGGAVGTVILDTRLTDSLVSEGLAREVTNRIQTLRKERDLDYTARIRIHVRGSSSVLAACTEHRDSIAEETLASVFEIGGEPGFKGEISESTLGDGDLSLCMETLS